MLTPTDEADRSTSRGSLPGSSGKHPITPDGRYFVVRGRLWRQSNPALPVETKERWVKALMAARRMLRDEKSAGIRAAARHEVDMAKKMLGERGPVWWSDGAPDYNRKLVKNTPYAEWFDTLPGTVL